MGWFLGIDIGSVQSKGVLIRDSKLAGHLILRSGSDYRRRAEEIRDALLTEAGLGLQDLCGAAATGTGGGNVYFAKDKVSDILCTARGMNNIFPNVKTVIDVAGQATKAMHIDEEGRVFNFTISEKCAAGSGRFIEVIANVLRIDLKDFGSLSLRSRELITFSTGCAVFGESEAITRVAEGVPKEDIAAGVNRALTEKITSLVKKIRLEEPCAICGGGALNIGLIKALEKELKVSLLVPNQPQIVAALGAAMMARSCASM